MKQLCTLTLLLCTLYSGLMGQSFSFENQEISSIDNLFTEDMLLLSPMLRGAFHSNTAWPGLVKNSPSEIGLQVEGLSLYDLSLWGSYNARTHPAGLLLTGYHQDLGEWTVKDTMYNGDSIESRFKRSDFTITGKSFLLFPHGWLLDGLSGDIKFEYSNLLDKKTVSGERVSYLRTDSCFFFSIHVRAVRRLPKGYFIYADGWLGFVDSIKYYDSKENSSVTEGNQGISFGIGTALKEKYSWRASFGYEYFNRTMAFWKEQDNSKYAIDFAFTRKYNYGKLSQLTGAKIRLFSVLNNTYFSNTDLEGPIPENSGFFLEIPLLLNYSPVPSLSLYSSYRVKLEYINYENVGEYLYNDEVFNTTFFISPLSLQWQISQKHFITIISKFNGYGIWGSSLEYRINF